MRILLDENLDWRLRRSLPGHVVDTVAYIVFPLARRTRSAAPWALRF